MSRRTAEKNTRSSDSEVLRDGSSHLNHAIYHDRCLRTQDEWKFSERVYEIRYLDITPLAGSAPHDRSSRLPHDEAGDES